MTIDSERYKTKQQHCAGSAVFGLQIIHIKMYINTCSIIVYLHRARQCAYDFDIERAYRGYGR